MNNWKFIALFLYWTNFSVQNRLNKTHSTRTSQNSSKFVQHSWITTTQKSSAVPNHYLPDVPKYEEWHNRPRRSDSENVSGIVIEQTTAKSFDDWNYSEVFLACGKSMVEREHFSVLANGSVYVPMYKTVFNKTDYVLEYDGLWICPRIIFNTSVITDLKFSPYFAIVSMVGAAISTVCILLHIAVFITFKKLRNLPSYNLFSLCIALLIAYLCLYLPYAQEEGSNCAPVAIIKAYCFLASFFWMNVMSYDIWRALRLAVIKLRSIRDRPIFTRLAVYSAYAWGMPLLIVTVGLIISSKSDADDQYKLLMDNESCWFLYRQALLIYFAIPLFIILFINFLFFVSCLYMISSGTMNTTENKADLLSRFFTCLRLATVMGLTWIFGVLATATEATWLWYFHALCNAMQGVFIFFSYTFAYRVRKEFRKAIQKKKSSVLPIRACSIKKPTNVYYIDLQDTRR